MTETEIKFYLPDGTPAERPYPEKVEFPDGDDGYTDKPTHLRIYLEDTGDEWPWHIDGCDVTGHYTEAVERYATEQEAVNVLPRFVHEFLVDKEAFPARIDHVISEGQP